MDKVEIAADHYENNLKAKEYNEKFNRILHLIPENFKFILKFLHDAIQSGRFQGSKVLEVGSGATVHNIASASARFTRIVQSDYVTDNCEELKRWHRGTSALDWSQFLEIVVELEGSESDPETARKNMESRIRKSVRSVVHSDVLFDRVISAEELTSPDLGAPYDLVISVLAIETAARDYDSYVEILRRLCNLLRKGAGILICGYANGSPWQIGDHVFPHVKLSAQQILDALDAAGFGQCNMKTRPKTPSEYAYEYEAVFCVAAEKI